MKRFMAVLTLMVLIPYVTTLAWTGRLNGEIAPGIGSQAEGGRPGTAGERCVITVNNGRETAVPVEEFLVPVLAAQIPANFGPETLKAQAVLARTYIYREMDGAETIYEEALDMDVLSRDQMVKLWGSGNFASRYDALRTAVQETEGQVITCQGALIEPLFCRASAGRTRMRGEDYPYLKQAESPGDLLADGYLSISVFSAETLAERIGGIPGAVPVTAAQLPGEIQIAERDSAGYVKQIQIGQKTYTGEEVQYALGLSSPCYSFEEFDGKIRVICKGIGHGYGFSQAGAREMEKAGKNYEELLSCYFQNIEIIKG